MSIKDPPIADKARSQDTQQNPSEDAEMSTARWLRLQDIFDAALEMPAAERADYVSRRCDGDHAMEQQVEALLLETNDDNDLVSNLVSDANEDMMHLSQMIGRQIGTFKILELLGEGGMGAVYLAQRVDDEFEQHVAIKVLHDYAASQEMRRRFLAERQILADLNHGNIARLLDGGHTEDGKPYLVMEYIDGLPLNEYCDKHQLTLRARLELFGQVCDAVAEAHRMLIVHRDIKSGNILVGEDGIPKLLDFGIAKVLNRKLGSVDLAETQHGARLLTPDYASPEQVLGQAITTTTDVYSLGILLYQLACGKRPFNLAGCSVAELEHIICHQVPVSLSQNIANQSPDDAIKIAGARNTSVQRLSRNMQGDLEAIVQMALKKEPERRYLSATQMGSDIRRYLTGRPIIAAHDTRRYRASKFIARNRIPLALATLAAVSLTAFSVTTAVQSQRIKESARQIIQERDIKLGVANIISEGLSGANPEVLQKREPTVLDLLNYTEQKTSGDLSGQPEIRAQLRLTLGDAYVGQQKLEKALNNYLAAFAASQEVYGETHPMTAKVLHALGLYYSHDEWDTAMTYYLRAEAILNNPEIDRFFIENSQDLVMAKQELLRDIAVMRISQDEWQLAEERLTRAVELVSTATEHPDYAKQLASNLTVLGALHQRLSNFDKAETFSREAIRVFRQHESPTHSYMSVLLEDLAIIKHSQADLVAAEALYRESLEILTPLLGEKHPKVLRNKGYLSRVLSDAGDLLPAQKLLQEVIDGGLRSPDNETYFLGYDLAALAVLSRKLEQFDEAATHFEDARAVYRRTIGKQSQLYADATRQFGILRVLQNRFDQAEALFKEAESILLSEVGEDHWMMAATRSEWSEIYIQRNDGIRAVELLNSARPVLQNTLGDQHRLLQDANRRYAEATTLLENGPLSDVGFNKR